MAIRRCPRCPVCSRREKSAAGLHGANRLGGNSLSDLLVFGRRAGRYAAEFAKGNGAAAIDEAQLQAAATAALKPFDRGPAGENPYQIQYDLQESMQDLVGIVRTEGEMQQALEVIGAASCASGPSSASRATASTTTDGTPRWIWRIC